MLPHLSTVAAFCCAALVLAADTSNATQHIVPNAAGDAAIDPKKVQKYKGLLDNINWDNKFQGLIKWNDIIENYAPINAACSERCLACGSGCSPSCCELAASPQSGESLKAPDSSTFSPRFPGIWRPRPIPALGCPCHCESWCPRYIQNICCFTPAIRPLPGSGSPPVALGAETQKTFLDHVLNPQELIWGQPGRPEACPCHCEPSCPGWIQNICCTTPGSGAKADPKPGTAPKLNDILALVTETAAGDPVNVLAAVNLTVFDSFITFSLVNGLQRADEIVYNDDLKTWEIILNVVAGPSGKEVTLAQAFLVLDGSRLFEEEQILLGSGFMNRIGGVSTKKEFLTSLQEGLPLVTGSTPTESKHAEEK